jgi:tetratricopeptide (TPR) repeat protein
MKFFSQLTQNLTQKWRAIQQESAVREAYEEGRLDEAIAHAHALYEFDLENPWANFFLACHHLEAERYGEALQHLARVQADWPDDAYTHFAVGLCQDYLEVPDAAIPAYRRVLELVPEWAKARKNLGRDLYLTGDYPGAETALHVYCADMPNDREAHDLLGYVCYRQGKLRDSFGHYESARRLDPFNAKLDRNARLLYMKSARS